MHRLQVIILIKLGGMRDLGHLAALGTLGFDKAAEQLLGEDAARGQVVGICFECIQRGIKRGGQPLELCLFFLGQVEEVEVVGTPALGVRINFVF